MRLSPSQQEIGTSYPAWTGWPVVTGAVLWVLSVVFFVIQGIAQAASTVPYHMATQLISDLGNTSCGADICSPLHTWVNIVFIATGAMHLLGALLTYSALPQRRLGLLPTVLMMVAGAGLIVAGGSPENVDAFHHAAGAIVGVISLNLAVLIYGQLILGSRKLLGRFALSAGVIGLVGTGYFLIGGLWPTGIAERVADYPSAVMVVVLGIALLVHAAADRRSQARSRMVGGS